MQGEWHADTNCSRTFWKLRWLKSPITVPRASADCTFWIIPIIVAELVSSLRVNVNSDKSVNPPRGHKELRDSARSSMSGGQTCSCTLALVNHLILIYGAHNLFMWYYGHYLSVTVELSSCWISNAFKYDKMCVFQHPQSTRAVSCIMKSRRKHLFRQCSFQSSPMASIAAHFLHWGIQEQWSGPPQKGCKTINRIGKQKLL